MAKKGDKKGITIIKNNRIITFTHIIQRRPATS